MLAGLGTGFLGIVPSGAELDVTPAEIARRGGLAALLDRGHVRLDLDGDLEASLGALLAPSLPPTRREHREVLRALVEDDVGYASELLPGALVAHVRTRAVGRARLAVGLHRRGLRHPRGRGPLHAVVVLLSPQEGPAQAHLARLSNVVQRLHEVGGDALAAARDADEVVALLTAAAGRTTRP